MWPFGSIISECGSYPQGYLLGSKWLLLLNCHIKVSGEKEEKWRTHRIGAWWFTSFKQPFWLSTQHFSLHIIGQNLITWLQPGAKTPGNVFWLGFRTNRVRFLLLKIKRKIDVEWQLVSVPHRLSILAQVMWFFFWNTLSLVDSLTWNRIFAGFIWFFLNHIPPSLPSCLFYPTIQ